MSSGHYHKRWSASTNGRTTPTSVSLSSAVEPSTYGTSWNSVRWNKPSTGYRSQSSSIAARFEKPSYTSPSPARGTSSSRFSTGRTYSSGISDAAKSAASLSSLGPSVSSRASRFDSTIRDNKEKYRTEARELINKWTSRERPTADNSYSNSYGRKPFESSSYKSKSSDFPYRKSASMTPTRTTIPSVARYSSLDRTSTGLLSPSPTPQSQTPKMDRPWRQRMAEASRIRATHGDEVSASYAAARRDSSRRGSLSQASGDELGSCLGTIRSYLSNSGYTSRDTSVYGPTSRFSTSATSPYRKEETPKTPTVSKYMSRSYSPVRSPLDVFKTNSASKVSSLAPPEKSSRPSSRESVREERKESHVSAIPKNPSIRESSKERENERKKSASIKDRTARRNSRQRSQQESSSSGDEDREEARKRRRRRRNDNNDVGPLPPSTNGSMSSQAKSLQPMENRAENGKSPSLASAAVLPAVGGTGATCLLVNASEDDFQSCAESPRMGQKISRNNSGTRLPSKSQIIKSPSVVEVPGISKSDSRPDVTAPSPSIAPSVAESTSIHLFHSNSLDNIDELVYDSEDNSSVQGDESQYSAVAHFKPYKAKVKRIAPVPGLWQKPGEPVCISKNKAFIKEEEHKTAFIIMKVKRKERASKKIVKKKPLAAKNGEEKKEQKITQDSPVKKLVGGQSQVSNETKDKEFLGRKKAIKPENENEEEEKKPKVEPKVKEASVVEKAKPKAVPEKVKEEKVKEMEVKEKPKPVEVKEKPKVTKEQEKPKVAQPAKTPVAVAKDQTKLPETKKEAPKETVKPKEVPKEEKAEKPKEVPVEKKKEAPKETPKPQPPKPQPPKEETVAATASFVRKPTPNQRASGVRKDKTRLSLAKKYKAIGRPAAAAVEKTFGRKAVELKTQKTVKTRPNTRVAHKLKCKASVNASVTISSELDHQEMSSGAQVIVDRPQKGVNAARVKLRCRQPQNRQSMPSHSELAQKGGKLAAEFEKAKLRVLQEEPLRSPSRESQSKAAEMLDEMRNTEPALEWRRRDSGGQLILPDKSVLEEYVKRKRGRLERLHSEPLRDRDEQCDSPCNSSTSELLPACHVRVFGASPREVPVITAPSRTSSVETPTAMLDSIQTISFNNFNSTPQAFLRNNTARLQCSKPIQFDTPKTPFEERMQQQANAIRKASVCSTQDGSEIGDSGRRLSQQGDGMSISSAFTAAMAEKAGQNRHERYAAHIPVNRGETSGRQSAASVDSTQSGVLDTATKQLDQVIDQARHRHHAHRSKFKEAIDYLDQIFEDLKKECDVNGEDKNNNNDTVTATVNVVPKDIKRPTVIQPSSCQLLKTNSLPDRAHRHQRAIVQTQQSPVELTVGKKSSANNTPPETTVTETIVLPRKTDKLDFTRRWLQDDLSSLAHQPPAPIAMFPEQCMYTDADEHSLGSCSAEVAAINAGGRKEKQKKTSTTTVPKIVTQPAPIRPQPQRPMPLQSLPGSSNGSRHFPVEYDGLQRVQSFDHVQADRRENSVWRAGSQEPYQTLGSMRSDTDNLRPSPSAFTNVNMFPQRGGMRGSLRSLPDANIVRGSKLTPPRDPVLAIDQLVAELELNTDQPTSAADKRRSFPTSLRAEAPEPTRTGSERQGSRGRHNGYGGHFQQQQQQQGYPAQQIRHQRQQRSLDEAANMLQNVVGDLGMSQQKHKKQVAAQFLGQQSKPFETINQEKINPSRVEAMHNMFERGGGANKSWRSPQPYQQQAPQPYKPPKEEELIYDLADYAVKAYKRVSPPRQVQTVRQSPLNSSQEFTPAYPLSQPPQHPPGRNGSANSSTNGGYYSSNSSTAGPSQPPAHHRSSLIGRQSLVSSRGPSVDDEDDGFYDNIGVFDDRRFSRGSEMDVASISSRPPANSQKHTRIGSFFRKIGGSSRPPGSAASLISLNKVANEAPIRSGVLMKSNSLSNEPWKKEVLQQSMPREASASKASLGSRLKNSLFGSKKRLNG